MNVAAESRFQSTPVTTVLLGDSNSNSYSISIAQKLARKTKKQVFISYNINYSEDSDSHQEIQNRLFEELKLHPNKFGLRTDRHA